MSDRLIVLFETGAWKKEVEFCFAKSCGGIAKDTIVTVVMKTRMEFCHARIDPL